MRRQSDTTTEVMLISVTLIWGTNLSVIKRLYAYFDPLALNEIRLILAALTMLAILRIRGERLGIERGDLPRLFLMGLLSNTAYQIFFSFGLDRTRAGNVGLLMALVPLFAYLASLAGGGERFSRRVALGITLSILGAMAVVLAGTADVSFTGTWQGDLMIVGSSFCWGWFTGSATGLIGRYGALRFTTITMTFGAAMLLPITIPRIGASDLGNVPLPAWGILAATAWLAMVYNFFVWNRAVHSMGSAHTAVIGNLTPIVALGAGWALLGERPVLLQGISVVLILAGIHMVRTASGRTRLGDAA